MAEKSLFEKILLKVMPGGGFATSNLIGARRMLAMLFRVGWRYRRTFFYLLTHKGLRAAYNFFYTKMFVPVGEGAGAGVYFLVSPLVRKYPRLFAPRPRYVEIETTTVCNRRCIICEHTYWKDQEERHVSFEEFKTLYNNFGKLRWLHLTGEGASFLNPDYPKMLRYAKERDLSVFLVDNFDALNENIMRDLIDMGIDGVYISVDGATKETYEKIRVGCNFDRVVRNIKRFIELKKESRRPVPEISFRYVITTLNVHEMPDFIDWVAGLADAKTLGDGSRLDFVGNLEFKEVEHLSIKKIPQGILDACVEKARRVKNVNVFFSHIEPAKNPPINNCIAWLEPYIMMGGYVLPCCSVLMSNKRTFLREHSFGNLYEKKFDEIWNSPRYKKFRDSVTNPCAKVPALCYGCRGYNTSERAEKYGVDEDL